MHEEQKRILKLVEEGKLSADDALSLLNDLEKSQETAEKKQEEMVHDLSTFVISDEKKQDKEAEADPFNFQTLKGKIVDFVDTTYKKIRDFDLDFNFGQGVEISHVLQHGDATLQKVDVEVANGSVQVLPWAQKDIRIECKAKVYRGSNQEEAREHFLKDAMFKIELGTLYFSTQSKWMKVEAKIYIPQQDYEKVRIRMFNGPITCENLKVKSLKMKSANGKIAAAGLYGLDLDAETANGKIEIQNSRVKELEVETLNGAIQLEGEYSRAEVQSFNGNITYQLSGPQSEKLDAKTVTGSIYILLPDELAAGGDLKSNLGNFTVELDKIKIIEEKNEMVQKSLHFTPIASEYQPLRVEAETKTGSISIKKAETVDFTK